MGETEGSTLTAPTTQDLLERDTKYPTANCSLEVIENHPPNQELTGQKRSHKEESTEAGNLKYCIKPLVLFVAASSVK